MTSEGQLVKALEAVRDGVVVHTVPLDPPLRSGSRSLGTILSGMLRNSADDIYIREVPQ